MGAAEGVAPIRSQNAQLTVYVPPEDPFIVQGDMMEVTEDLETSLECVSPGGKPAADVSSRNYFNFSLSQHKTTASRNLHFYLVKQIRWGILIRRSCAFSGEYQVLVH